MSYDPLKKKPLEEIHFSLDKISVNLLTEGLSPSLHLPLYKLSLKQGSPTVFVGGTVFLLDRHLWGQDTQIK